MPLTLITLSMEYLGLSPNNLAATLLPIIQTFLPLSISILFKFLPSIILYPVTSK